MDCNSCKDSRPPVPFLVHENDMAKLETANRRWFIAWLVTFVLLVGVVAGFIWYESQWEVVESTEVEQDIDTGDGDALISGVGDIFYGAGQTDGN